MPKKDAYLKMSDEELVIRYRSGDNKAADYLVEKYKNLVRMRARAYFLVGADSDDIIQEGMIGLYKAIRDYNPDKGVVFMVFASLCINRQILTAVTSYNRQKNSPLNSYISLDTPITDELGEDARLSDVIAAEEECNPEELFIAKEQSGQLIAKVFKELSTMERQTLELYVEGLSYAEIATALNKTPKAVDNAIQRIRNKINSIRN
ncbi:MAG: RNA polymerase sporulation sigma factor SigH [Butyrivibrio sp.]